MAGARRYEELIAWQLADAFQSEIYRLVFGSWEAHEDTKFKTQIMNSADSVGVNIAEGFRRFSPGDFRRFLDYSLSSLAESARRLKNGIARRYFEQSNCAEALQLAKRATKAIIRLKQSQRKRGR